MNFTVVWKTTRRMLWKSKIFYSEKNPWENVITFFEIWIADAHRYTIESESNNVRLDFHSAPLILLQAMCRIDPVGSAFSNDIRVNLEIREFFSDTWLLFFSRTVKMFFELLTPYVNVPTGRWLLPEFSPTCSSLLLHVYFFLHCCFEGSLLYVNCSSSTFALFLSLLRWAAFLSRNFESTEKKKSFLKWHSGTGGLFSAGAAFVSSVSTCMNFTVLYGFSRENVNKIRQAWGIFSSNSWRKFKWKF